ncbi:MAG: hypothetical protein ACSHYA_12710 [Opitutaceae bacterium]
MLKQFQHLLAGGLVFAGLTSTDCVAKASLGAEFFPDLANHSEESIRLRGLAELYPQTILFEDPKIEVRSLREEAARVEKLPQDITYVRVYRLKEAVTAIKEVIDQPALILDLRYLKSENSGIELARLLNRCQEPISVSAVGKVSITVSEKADSTVTPRNHPAIILCNRETAGPFEAVLHNLQSLDCVIAVGEATAGRTGSYRAEGDNTWIIEGEVRPTPELSLLTTGFVPRIEIEATPTSNYLSYHLYEAGTPINRLLRRARQQSLPASATEGTETESAEPSEPDAVLQRAIDIVAALQILQQLPENK